MPQKMIWIPMSRNQMIRYILNVAKSSSETREKINETNLRKLIKKCFGLLLNQKD